MPDEKAVVATDSRRIVRAVEDSVKMLSDQGRIDIPPGYSFMNALKFAQLEIEEKGYAMDCTEQSIKLALLKMITLGLNPGKQQVYLIKYKNKLQAMPSIWGEIMLAKRMAGVKSAYCMMIEEADTFDYEIENGQLVDILHTPSSSWIFDSKSVPCGAYAVVKFTDDDKQPYIVLMTWQEILTSWTQSYKYNKAQAEGNTESLHSKFSREMAKRTVIRRALKPLLNASDDHWLLEKNIADIAQEIQAEEAPRIDLPDISEDDVPGEPEMEIPMVIEPEVSAETVSLAADHDGPEF